MPSKSLLTILEDSVDDIKVIHEFYCENGADGIIEMIPPVKYLLACISDILNDGLNNNKGGFYAYYKDFSRINGRIHGNWDEFDEGLVWIIQQLNSRSLYSLIHSNYERIKYYYKKTGLIVVEKEIIMNLLKNLGEFVKFNLYQEDLYTMRIRFKKKSEQLDDTENTDKVDNADSIESDVHESDASDASDVMSASFISMEAIDVKLLQERELRNDFGFMNKLKYNSIRFINNFRISSKLKQIRSDFNVNVSNDDDFESINIYSKLADDLIKKDLLKMEICPEKGLISQNYSCSGCGNGISSKDSIKCDFNGFYMCPNCHGNERCINPLRILKNWDFKRYPICRDSKKMIANLSYNCLVNFAQINPKEFKSNEKFRNVQILREKIVKSTKKRLEAAGKTEGPKQFAMLEKLAWPKTHLLTSSNLFTIEDLIEIENGKFNDSVLLPLYNLLKL